jgi:hypothetical protein
MNEGWLNYGIGYVIARHGLGEMLGLVSETYRVGDSERALVLLIPDDSDAFEVSMPTAELREATALEIYQHGEERLKRQQLGTGYGANADKTMWDLMSERDKAYWRSLRPKEGDA